MAFPALPTTGTNWATWGTAVHTAVTTTAFNVKNYGAVGNDVADDTAAIQAAAAAVVAAGGGTLLFPRGAYRVAASITLGPNVTVRGDGWPTITATTTAPLFVYQAANGTQQIQAPHFLGLKCYGRNIVKLNSIGGGFTDDSTTQNFLMKPVVADCDFFSDSSGLGIGVQICKAFDYTITRSWISGFSIDLDLHGSDIGTVDNNRFGGGTIAQIRLTSYGTFGSQANISRNDMLDLNSGCYVLSSDYDLRVRDNYVESATHAFDAVIRATNAVNLRVTGNRIEARESLCPNWLDVQVDVAAGEFTNNTSSGLYWGPAKFPTGGPRYYYNGFQRQKITHHGNQRTAGMPFNALESTPLPSKVAFLWTPDLPGLAPDYYGATTQIADGGAILPTDATFTNLLTFPTGVAGTLNGGLIAKGSSNGQELVVQLRDGSTILEWISVILTTSYAYYPLFTSKVVADCRLFCLNAAGGNIYLKSVTVDYA